MTCDIGNGYDFGCCAAGLVCKELEGSDLSQCRKEPLTPTTSAPVSSSPTSASVTAQPSIKTTERPTTKETDKPSDGSNVCTGAEWFVCDSLDGYDYGCCAEGLVCEEAEGMGFSHCRPAVRWNSKDLT
eukprot:scaffold102616_cov52-Cyclotella_meneghiniana.AAC.2